MVLGNWSIFSKLSTERHLCVWLWVCLVQAEAKNESWWGHEGQLYLQGWPEVVRGSLGRQSYPHYNHTTVGWWAYSCPVSTISNWYILGSLKQQKLIFSQFWSQKSNIKVSRARGSRVGFIQPLPASSGSRRPLGCGCVTPVSCLHLQVASPLCLSSSVSLKDICFWIWDISW